MEGRAGGESAPAGRRAATVHQWHRNGRRGVYLETVKIKGMNFTCEARVLSYFSRLARPVLEQH